jgi:hypothetical protein
MPKIACTPNGIRTRPATLKGWALLARELCESADPTESFPAEIAIIASAGVRAATFQDSGFISAVLLATVF